MLTAARRHTFFHTFVLRGVLQSLTLRNHPFLSLAVNVYLPKDRVTNAHMSYGFVEFRSEDDADYVSPDSHLPSGPHIFVTVLSFVSSAMSKRLNDRTLSYLGAKARTADYDCSRTEMCRILSAKL